jgi:hypothetical protein
LPGVGPGLGEEEPAVDTDRPEGGTMVEPGGEQGRSEHEPELGRPQRPPQRRPSELSDHDPVDVEAAVLGLVADHEFAHLAEDGVAGAAEQPEIGAADELGDDHRLDLEPHSEGMARQSEATVGPVLRDQRPAEPDDEMREQAGVFPLLGHEQRHGRYVVGIVGPVPAGAGQERCTFAALPELEVGQGPGQRGRHRRRERRGSLPGGFRPVQPVAFEVVEPGRGILELVHSAMGAAGQPGSAAPHGIFATGSGILHSRYSSWS